MSHYTMLSKYGNYKSLLKIKNKLKIGCFYYFVVVFSKTIIPVALVGMVDSQLISNAPPWNNC